MRKKLIMALALIATMAFGCLVFESSSFAQNTNSSTTNKMGDMSGKHMGRRRHRRVRRHRRWGRKHNEMKTGNGNKH
ncbi:MAG: hypothetical protein JWM21_2738 [Acidobacteria bacterium]|nr:hypothetical protein [Acidobacteriota bacterium]